MCLCSHLYPGMCECGSRFLLVAKDQQTLLFLGKAGEESTALGLSFTALGTPGSESVA